MSGDRDRAELISEWAHPWTDQMRLPLLPIERLQQCNQIAFCTTDGFNPMHVQDSRAHYLASG